MTSARHVLWIVLCAAASAAAQSGWDAVPPAERALLAPWQAHWDTLDDARRDQLRRNARHWQGLAPEQRSALQARIARFDALPPAERARIRGNAAAWARMDADTRARLRAEHARLRALAPVESKALRDAFAALGASARRGLLLDEDERDLVDVARRAFAFVPPDERAATLEMLRALSGDDLERLGELARRIAPDARAQVRRDLLARPREARGAYLRERLERS